MTDSGARCVEAIKRLSAAERQALMEWYQQGRERWKDTRPHLADYCNDLAGELWDEGKRQERALAATERDFAGEAGLMPDED